jgi:hypothetical protein
MKNLKYIITILAIAVVAVSCETNFDDVNDDRLAVVGLTSAVGGPNAIVPVGGTLSKEVNVYVSDISSTERSFAVTVDNEITELGSENYVIGNAVIPANQRTGTLTVTFSDVNLSSTFQPLRLKVDNSTGTVVSGAQLTLQARRAN